MVRRLGEVGSLVQGHIDDDWQKSEFILGSKTLKPILLTLRCYPEDRIRWVPVSGLW